MKTLTNVVAVALVLSTVQSLLAEDTPKKDAPQPEAAKTHHERHPLLGVLVSSAHPALANNLGDLLSPEQGLIVEELIADSPAAKAGIKVHDILTTYDDQKLFSAEQLAKLVHSDRPGREVKMGYLRRGKLHTTEIKLGESKSLHHRAWRQPTQTQPQASDGLRHLQRRPRTRHAAGNNWENFDSLTLKKLDDNKFRAEVQYLDTTGKSQKHVFEGTREEIKKSIEDEKDLKPAERAHLLRSLNLNTEDDELLWIPGRMFESSDDAF